MTFKTAVNVSNQTTSAIKIIRATSTSKSSAVGYKRTLSNMRLSTGDTLAAGAQGTLALTATRVNAEGKTVPESNYDLYACVPNSLRPIRTIDLMALPDFPDILIAQADLDKANLALQFYRNIQASPSSKMAKDFYSQIDNIVGAAKDAEFATFMAKYPTYESVDLDAYLAVSSWLTATSYMWGLDDNLQPGATYYLYGVHDVDKTDVAQLATIKFDPISQAEMAAATNGLPQPYTITLTDTDSKESTVLSFSDGVVTDGGGSISLACSFTYRGLLTNDKAKSDVVSMMSGTYLGNQVIASQFPPTNSKSTFDEKNFNKVMNYVGMGMGLLMFGTFLFEKGMAFKKARAKAKLKKGKELTDKEQTAAEKSVKPEADKLQADAESNLRKVTGSESATLPEDGKSAGAEADALRSEFSDVLVDRQRLVTEQNIEAQENMLKTLGDEGFSNDQMSDAVDNINSVKSALEEGDIKKASALADSNGGIIKSVTDQATDDIKTQVADDLQVSEESSAAIDELSETQSEVDEEADEENSGFDPEDDEIGFFDEI